MRTFASWFLVFFFSSAIHAQEQPARSVHLEFSSVSWSTPIDNLSFSASGKNQPHFVPAYRRSERQTYTGPAILDFTESVTDDSGKTTKRVTRVTLPADTPRVLLLWSRLPDGSLTAQAVSEDPSKFALGQARLFNASAYRLAVKTGGEVLQLEPGQSAERGGDGKRFILQIAYQYQEDGKWRSAGNNVFALSPDTRRTIFFLSGGADYFKLVNSSGSHPTSGVQMFSIED